MHEVPCLALASCLRTREASCFGIGLEFGSLGRRPPGQRCTAHGAHTRLASGQPREPKRL